MQHAHDPENETLIAEELSSDEVRELLERLNARDMGGSENATVGAVMEATGASSTTVGRLLAEIRKENFEERFGLKQKEHEGRIESLESRTGRLESVKRPPVRIERTTPALDHFQQAALDRLGREEEQRQAMQPMAIVIVAIAVLLMILLFLAGQQSKNQPPKAMVGTQLPSGDWIEEQPDGTARVRTKGGNTRAPTREEEALLNDVRFMLKK